MNAPLELVPPGRQPRTWLFALYVVLPLPITGGALAWSRVADGPRRLLADSMLLSSLTTFAGTALLTVSLWWLLDRAMRRHRLELGDGSLRVLTSFYSRTLRLPELRLDSARVVDLQERPEFTPSLKTNGYALPGFRSGHFRLRNGDSAFVAISGGQRVLWLPVRSGKGLLLQPRAPEALLCHLRELAKATPRR